MLSNFKFEGAAGGAGGGRPNFSIRSGVPLLDLKLFLIDFQHDASISDYPWEEGGTRANQGWFIKDIFLVIGNKNS